MPLFYNHLSAKNIKSMQKTMFVLCISMHKKRKRTKYIVLIMIFFIFSTIVNYSTVFIEVAFVLYWLPACSTHSLQSSLNRLTTFLPLSVLPIFFLLFGSFVSFSAIILQTSKNLILRLPCRTSCRSCLTLFFTKETFRLYEQYIKLQNYYPSQSLSGNLFLLSIFTVAQFVFNIWSRTNTTFLTLI